MGKHHRKRCSRSKYESVSVHEKRGTDLVLNADVAGEGPVEEEILVPMSQQTPKYELVTLSGFNDIRTLKDNRELVVEGVLNRQN